MGLIWLSLWRKNVAPIAFMIEFIGKFHPLFVHLPIGFLVLLGALEWLARRPHWKELAPANRVILLLAIPVSFASAVCGWLLAGNGDYDTNALFWHRWLGTGVAVATGILWVLRQHGWLRAYRRSLLATLLLLAVASHFGGSLTHGSDFLSWPKPRPAQTKPLTEAQLLASPVYATVIQPIFDQYCVQCHGAKKSKAGLRLDSAANLLKGSDDGSVLEASGADISVLGQRLTLPVDNEDHMPPEGKPQLSEAQLAVIRWWLDAGAPIETILSELKPEPEILRAIQAPSLTTSSDPADTK